MDLKQLAKLLDLSPTTVSRALNGFPEVSQKTRLRVLGAAKEYNYQPNAKAKGLATGRTNTIGHLIPISAGHEMVNPVFSDFIAGASKAYMAAGYDMLLSLVDDENEADAYRNVTARGRVDGLIVHGPKLQDNRVELLNSLDVPFVVHGRLSSSDGYSWVDVNNSRAFSRGTNYLLELGHKRVALINGLESMVFAKHRNDGYCESLRTQQVAIDSSLLVSGEMTEPFGYGSARRMLQSENPPTAFIVSSMILAIGVRRAIEERGLKLGVDVSLVAYDDDLSYLTEASDVPVFTSLRSSVREAGRRCAENLLFLIDNPHHEPLQELWEASLIIGESTGVAARKT